MSAYLINHLRQPGVLRPEVLDYLGQVQATLDPFEGKFIVQGGEIEVLEGTWPQSVVVLSFPDMSVARAWYRSPAYQKILHLRTDHTVGDVILVDGVAPDHTPAKFAKKLRTALSAHVVKNCLYALIALFALLTSSLKAEEQKAATITQLLSTTTTSSGQSIVLPKNNVQVVASIFDGLPSSALQAHNHPYPRYVYVLSGTLRVNNLDTGQTNSYRAGSFILESIGQWQTSASAGDGPLKLLVVDVVEKGQSNTVGLR